MTPRQFWLAFWVLVVAATVAVELLR